MAIWLTVIIGITQLLLGGMGVYVSLRPPKPEHHWRWIAAFAVVGLSGIGATGHLAKAGEDAQRYSNIQINQAQVAATGAQDAATKANTAATNANTAATNAATAATNAATAATVAQHETEQARTEA